jgi:hypothetical protein
MTEGVTLGPCLAILTVLCHQERRTMHQDELKSEMRLYAVEFLAVNILAAHLLTGPDPQQLLAEMRRQMIEGAGVGLFPNSTRRCPICFQQS